MDLARRYTSAPDEPDFRVGFLVYLRDVDRALGNEIGESTRRVEATYDRTR